MLEQVVLGVSAFVFVGVAVQGLFLPIRIVAPLGGKLETPSLANEIRANYGGMHLAIAVLLSLGAAQAPWRAPALALLFAFTAGLCLGRVVSWVADGRPNRFIRVFFALEAVGAAIAGALLATRS